MKGREEKRGEEKRGEGREERRREERIDMCVYCICKCPELH